MIGAEYCKLYRCYLDNWGGKKYRFIIKLNDDKIILFDRFMNVEKVSNKFNANPESIKPSFGVSYNSPAIEFIPNTGQEDGYY